LSKEENKTPPELLAPLDAGVLEVVTKIGRFGEAEGFPVYLVGGIVRDLLLARKNTDIDLLVEGDAPQFLQKLVEHWPKLFPALPVPGKPIIFERYRTAKLPFQSEIVPGVRLLEFASTRSEHYPLAGGRPDVRPAGLVEDLARRDFTINAMAIAIKGYELIDFHGGQKDLEQGLLKVLHERSFLDDPARMLRAVRFSIRFNFQFERETEQLFERAVSENFLQSLPKPRLFDEFRKLLCEESPGPVLALMSKYGMLQQISPVLVYEKAVDARLSQTRDWRVRLRTLFGDMDTAEFRAVLDDFQVSNKEKLLFPA